MPSFHKPPAAASPISRLSVLRERLYKYETELPLGYPKQGLSLLPIFPGNHLRGVWNRRAANLIVIAAAMIP